ncbi:MAG: sugar MFS transporter [Lentimicrobiaceae bacterium]|nr:sugar MFS transporter [Lentimicrobiaceae bacterium]
MNTSRQPSLWYSLLIIGILYFVFGFITWLNSVLIPFLREACQLQDTQAYLVAFAFYISYFVMALPSSRLLKKTGFVKGMAIGLFVMAIGSLVFIPAAQQRNYGLFLIGLFLQGTGLALLQTAANPYVTILGPMESAARRMSIMGLFNKIAGMIGIFLLAKILFSDMTRISGQINTLSGTQQIAELNLLAQRVIIPYICIAVALALLAVMVLSARLPEVQNEEMHYGEEKKRSIFRFTYMWLGVLAIFVYVGAEVIAIDTLSLYAESQGVVKEKASMLGAYSLIAFVGGYLLGIVFVPKKLSQSQALTLSAGLSIVFAVTALCTTGFVSVIFIILLSFSHALMWPGIWPLALDKLGKHTATASAFLIMAIAGGAFLPLLYGKIATLLENRHLPYLILLPCYLYIAYYSIYGHKIGKNIQ